MLAAIVAQDLVKTLGNTKAALAKKKTTGIKLGAPTKASEILEQARALKGQVERLHRLHAQYLTQHGR
jgi:hypothetical protein